MQKSGPSEPARRMSEHQGLSQRIQSNSLWLFINQGVCQSMAFIATVYLARALGPAAFGIFSLSLAVGQSLAVLGDFGTSMYGTRLIAAQRESRDVLLPQLLGLRLMVSVGVFLVFSLLIFVLPLPENNYWIMFWGGLMVIVNIVNGEWFLRGIERMRHVAIGNFLIAMFFMISVFLVVTTPEDAEAAILMRSFSYLPGGLFMLIVLRLHEPFSFSPSALWRIPKKIFTESFSYMLIGGLNFIYLYLFILILGIFVDEIDLGTFSAAYRLFLAIILFGSVLPMAFFPILANFHQNEPERFRALHNFLQIILFVLSLPTAICGWIFAPELIVSLFGNQFTDSVMIFRIFIITVPVVLLRLAFGQGLLACGFQKQHFRANLAGCLVVALACFILIDYMGTTGAAIAFLLGEMTMFCLIFFSFAKKLFLPYPSLRDCGILFLISLVMVGAIEIIDLNFVWRLLFGLIVYSLGLFFSGLLKRHASCLEAQQGGGAAAS